MKEVTITIKLEVSPAIEKLIDVLATAQYYYDEDDDEESDCRSDSDPAIEPDMGDDTSMGDRER